MPRHRIRVFVPLALGLSASSVLAQSTPAGLSDLVGAKAAGGETQLQARGWSPQRTETSADRKFSYWWNAAQRQCISVSTYDGRYAAIVSTLPADCGRSEGASSNAGYEGDVINLVCYGSAEKHGYQAKTEYHWDADKHRYVYETHNEYGTQDYDTSVTLQFHGQDGRIRLPKKYIPPVHSGGSDQWWTLTDVRVTPTRITGAFRLNGMNKPKIDIDRRSGHINVNGMSDFSGTCDSIDRGQRRF